jgi:hypothetical protein
LRRGVFAASALFYPGVGIAVASIALGFRAKNDNQSTRDWTAWLMSQPFGRWAVAILGLIFAGVAVGLVVKVIRAPYRRRLYAGARSRTWAVALGSYGNPTRAFVFLMIGMFLCFAANYSDSTEAAGFSGVLRTLQRQAYGGLLLGVTALGLLAFGGFEILEAVLRKVRPPKRESISGQVRGLP